jgi:ABC-type nitrate/sulfonate/bicarbonate transport system permease component
MSLAPDSSSEWTTLDRPGRLARAARAVQQMLPTLLLSVAALIGWELVIRLGHVSTYIVPAPSAIAVALVTRRTLPSPPSPRRARCSLASCCR